MRRKVGWIAAIALALALWALPQAGTTLAEEGAASESEVTPPGSTKGKKEAWQSETPPGWAGWRQERRAEWRRRLARSRNAVRRHARRREDAAVRALEMAARKGVPLADAEQMARTGIDEGLAPEDFGPLGRTVSAWARQGLHGEELAAAVHQEVRRRQEKRRRLREQKKQEKGKGKGAGKADKGKPDDEDEDNDKGKGKGKQKANEDDGESPGKGRGKGKGKGKN